jgi:ABC-type multidrug transport system fused ATPase/permease subunit
VLLPLNETGFLNYSYRHHSLSENAFAKYSEPLSTKQQKNLDNINGILRENLSGLRVIRAFVNEKFEETRFRLVNDAYTYLGSFAASLTMVPNILRSG